MLKGEFVADIKGSLNLINKDTNVSDRYVLSVGMSYVKTFLAQRKDDGKLTDMSVLNKTISCFKLEPVEVIKCGFVELVNCNKVMKSVCRLPETLESNIGYSINSVSSIDNNFYFTETTRYKYSKLLKRKYVRNIDKYFFIEDGFLYIPNDETELVNINLTTLGGGLDSKCTSCEQEDAMGDCKSLWEEEFPCPDKLIMYVKQSTLQELGFKVRIPEDERPNLNSNEK